MTAPLARLSAIRKTFGAVVANDDVSLEIRAGEVRFVGKVGTDYDLAQAQQAARVCGLNLIAALRLACGGSLERVSYCLRLGGFVNCTPNFPSIPQVINGASDLMHELFGDRGHHARTAVGVANLPRGAAVEVDAIFAVT